MHHRALSFVEQCRMGQFSKNRPKRKQKRIFKAETKHCTYHHLKFEKIDRRLARFDFEIKILNYRRTNPIEKLVDILIIINRGNQRNIYPS